MSDAILDLRHISKEYSGNRVLADVSLRVRPGTIHALVGENGAGKSTLMNVLFGMPVIRDTGGISGEGVLCGRTVTFASPADAMAAGLGMVHQEVILIPGFSVVESVKLKRARARVSPLSRRFGRRLERLDRARVGADARAALDRVGLGVDEWLRSAGLHVGHMQFVEIAREVDKRGLRVLIFDEPTAVLGESEASQLLEVMRSLTSQGVGILFITHRLDEVMEVADDITVLRDGAVVARLTPADTSVERIAELMVGRATGRGERRARPATNGGTPALEVRDLEVDMPGERVRGVSFTLERGEILGLAGLAGHGKIGIANGLMGLYPARGGVIAHGKPLRLNDSRQAIHSRLAFV